MAQYGFYFDSNKCTACKTCQVACKETYMLPSNTLWRKVHTYQSGSWTLDEATGVYEAKDMLGYHISIACNHCANPACVAVCPTGAHTKDAETGITTINPEICIACGTCKNNCPYDSPSLNEVKNVMTKCDMCKGLIEKGEKPICVAGCLMRAFDFGELSELQAKYGNGDMEIEPLPVNSTDPSVVMNPHRNAVKSGEGTGRKTNLEEEYGN